MAIQYGETINVRFAGRSAEFRPMLDATKRPVRYPVSLDDRSMLNPVIGELSYNGGRPRAVVMGERPKKQRITKDTSIREQKREDGQPNRRFLQFYQRTNSRTVGGEIIPGGIFELPITDGREDDDDQGTREFDGQTVNYMVTNEATGERVDAYLAKGWSYATCEDVLRCWARAEQQAKAAAEARGLANPMVAIGKLTEVLADRLSTDKTEGKGKGA